jgi:hypothetical protein
MILEWIKPRDEDSFFVVGAGFKTIAIWYDLWSIFILFQPNSHDNLGINRLEGKFKLWWSDYTV